MAQPYVTPDMIHNAPTGMPWSIIPFPKATTEAQQAEQTNIAWRATNRVDGYCNQPLRSTLNTETLQGPDYRLTVDNSGVARAIMSRWPVTELLGGQVSPRVTFPRQWSQIPASAMDMESPPMGTYGTTVEGAAGAGDQAVLIAPGYVSWFGGRQGYTVQLAYLNGWPHAGLTAPVQAGATQLLVDDVTAFTGASAFVYDGAATEVVNVTAVTATTPVTLFNGTVVQTGPGALTLAAPVAGNHIAGITVSALPQDAAQATILFAAAQVLDAGVTSVTVQTVSGSKQTSQSDRQSLIEEAEDILKPFRRVI